MTKTIMYKLLFKKLRFWGWISIIVMFANFVNAHEIHLKNGKIIKTQSVWEKDGMVIYQKGGGTVKISKELVRTIIYDKPIQPSASPKDSNGLVAYYPFNGNANDTIDPRNNGVVHGARLAADIFGKLNNAYRFDGIDDYIQMNSPILSQPPFSVSFWFNAYEIKPDGQYLVSNGGPPGTQGLYCKLVGRNETYHARSSWPKSGIQCGVSSSENGFFAIVTKEAITLQQWHYVVFVWDGVPDRDHVFIFLDGKLASVLKEMGTREISSSPNNMRVGAPSDNLSSDFFKGIIDDIRIYNHVISVDAVQQLSH